MTSRWDSLLIDSVLEIGEITVHLSRQCKHRRYRYRRYRETL